MAAWHQISGRISASARASRSLSRALSPRSARAEEGSESPVGLVVAPATAGAGSASLCRAADTDGGAVAAAVEAGVRLSAESATSDRIRGWATPNTAWLGAGVAAVVAGGWTGPYGVASAGGFGRYSHERC